MSSPAVVTQRLLNQALAVGEKSVSALPFARPRPASDPLELELPPLPPTAEQFLEPASVSALGSLYFSAELENAGVLPAVEALVSARRSLPALATALAEQLERFATGDADHLTRAAREDLYARVFGLGPAARADSRSGANLGFAQTLCRFAAAVICIDEGRAANGRFRAYEQARLRAAAIALANTLALHRGNHVLFAAQKLHRRLLQALEILSQRELHTLIGARTAWDALERISGDAFPNAQTCLRRGASGQELVVWLGSILPALRTPDSRIDPSRQLALAAARWLMSYGVRIVQSVADQPRAVA
jgi:hypothetical protein